MSLRDDDYVLPLYFSPQGLEESVRRFFDGQGTPLQDYVSSHREITTGLDGEYEIDISASFVSLRMRFRVLIECKHHRRRVGRDPVMVLNQKLQSCGAQKGAVVSTSGFQSGAIEFAEHHGIALFQLENRHLVRILEAEGSVSEAIPPYSLEAVREWRLE